MQIILNGEQKSIAENTTAATLVEQLGLTGKRLAMEVNQNIIPRSHYDTFVFSANDCVELVQAIGGG